MKTRFDGTKWYNQDGGTPVADLETTHLINIVNFLIKNPLKIVNIIIEDLEKSNGVANYPDYYRITGGHNYGKNVLAKSISNITKQQPDDIVHFALHSKLGMAILQELADRGVDVKSLFSEDFDDIPDVDYSKFKNGEQPYKINDEED